MRTLLVLVSMSGFMGFGQERPSVPVRVNPNDEAVCKLTDLPSQIRGQLRGEFGSSKVQAPSDLNPIARVRWEAERPLKCPGIAKGRFGGQVTVSYSLLLVPSTRARSGYTIVVFTPKPGESGFKGQIVDQQALGSADNLFIRTVPIGKVFNEQWRRRLGAKAEGILRISAAEKEYQADVYFWSNGRFESETIDY